jgi:glycosyltransferase involved in cell wall biosynthesis
MKSSIYVTTASIGLGTGGGNVAYNEAKALSSATNLKAILGRSCKSPEFEKVFTKILPEAYSQWDLPFLFDYFTLEIFKTFQIRLTETDLVHFNGNPFGLTAYELKGKTKIFVTVPAHNLERSIEEFQNLGMSYPFIHMTDSYLWEIYIRHVRLADVVICPSEMSASYIKRKLNLTNRIVVIPHGCYLPEKTEPIPEKFDVAYLGQLGPDKGVIYLIQAWTELNLQDSTLILAGETPELAYQLINMAGGTGNYHLAGYVPDVSEIYNKCTVYVQPSVTEGFGIEVLEAMAHGRPVIVTEGAGAHEIVEDGKEGFIVPIRDPKAIATCIRYFRENPSEVEKFGKNARLKAEQYTWEKIRKMYEEIYIESS